MSALHKVLVVDDDPVVGKSFNRVLSEKGYIVTTAENAQEALDMLRAEEYEAVFTDIKMPGMDGVELAERVKAQRPWTPVVIITGYGTAENERRAKAAGVSAFLRKPLSPEAIEESASNALHETAPVSVEPIEAIRVEEAVRVEEAGEEVAEKYSGLKFTAMLVAGPVLGFFYAVLLPFIGIAALAWTAGKAFARIPVVGKALRFIKNVALFLSAPFVGLAYVVLFPFVGTAMIAWMGAKALMGKKEAE
jgi:CheY-like chemotaxis protein